MTSDCFEIVAHRERYDAVEVVVVLHVSGYGDERTCLHRHLSVRLCQVDPVDRVDNDVRCGQMQT